MNRCGYEQNATGGCEEMRADILVCPKPRRFGHDHSTFNDHIRPLRWPMNHQMEMGDSNIRSELLDLILHKGSYAEISGNQVASSPPFFYGSPPSRASNPLVLDEQFIKDKFLQFCHPPPDKFLQFCHPPPSPSATATQKAGGFARMNFAHKPAPVRIEGFDCLSRDRSNCSISAVA